MRLFFHILLFIGILLPATAIGQTATYRVSVGRFNVGEQTVKQTCNGDTLKVAVDSEVKVYVGFTNIVTYQQNSIYYKGYLLKSQVTVKRNGTVQSECKTQWNGKIYTIILDGKVSKYHKLIRSSGTLLYFAQPNKNQEVYSESDGKMKFISQKASGVYEMTHPEEKTKNTYEYKDGILQKTTIHHPLISFSTVLLNYQDQ